MCTNRAKSWTPHPKTPCRAGCPGSCSPEEWGLALPRQRKELMVTLSNWGQDLTNSSFSLCIFVVPTLRVLNPFPYKALFTLYCFISHLFLVFAVITHQLSTKQWPGNLWALEIPSGRLFCNSNLAPRAKPLCARREAHHLWCINVIWCHHLSNWRCRWGRICADRKLNCIDHEHLRVD